MNVDRKKAWNHVYFTWVVQGFTLLAFLLYLAGIVCATAYYTPIYLFLFIISAVYIYRQDFFSTFARTVGNHYTWEGFVFRDMSLYEEDVVKGYFDEVQQTMPKVFTLIFPTDENAYAFIFRGEPVIVVAESIYQRFSPKEIGFILGHELAHIKCRDLFILFAMRFLLRVVLVCSGVLFFGILAVIPYVNGDVTFLCMLLFCGAALSFLWLYIGEPTYWYCAIESRADTLSALYSGRTDYGLSALSKLNERYGFSVMIMRLEKLLSLSEKNISITP